MSGRGYLPVYVREQTARDILSWVETSLSAGTGVPEQFEDWKKIRDDLKRQLAIREGTR